RGEEDMLHGSPRGAWGAAIHDTPRTAPPWATAVRLFTASSANRQRCHRHRRQQAGLVAALGEVTDLPAARGMRQPLAEHDLVARVHGLEFLRQHQRAAFLALAAAELAPGAATGEVASPQR